MYGTHKQAKSETPTEFWTATRRTYPTQVTRPVGRISQKRMSFLSLMAAQQRYTIAAHA